MPTPIEQEFIARNPGSAQRYETAKNLFPDGVTHDARRLRPFPLYVTHADGPYKWDVDGHRIIDFRTGHGSMILGHAHPEVVAAVQKQMAMGTHHSASTDLEIEWAQRVTELIPSAEKVRFHSSGTEADMMAIRMARAYTGRTKVIKFDDHFHGWSDYLVAGSDGIGGIPDETLSTMIVLPPNDIAAVERAIQQNDVAAVILEPTGAHMGMYPIKPSFLHELHEVTERYGVILIFDEVVTGFRTSRGGAQAYYGVTPDMTTLAKILGGGLPGGAVSGKAALIDMIETRYDDLEWNRSRRIAHNGTFNANPLSAAAGVTALRLVATTPVNDTANARAEQLKNGLNDLLTRMEVKGVADGVASLIFLRLGVDPEDADIERNPKAIEAIKKATNAARDHQFSLAMLNHGVDSGNRFILGMKHSEQDIEATVDAAEDSLKDLREAGLV
ncbi:MAG: aspartate aminotransferase family protein [Chloroflexi bacterium]|nr:aspartate aminotransferase family protein [Chloroflexota bacterium]